MLKRTLHLRLQWQMQSQLVGSINNFPAARVTTVLAHLAYALDIHTKSIDPVVLPAKPVKAVLRKPIGMLNNTADTYAAHRRSSCAQTVWRQNRLLVGRR